MEGDHLNAGFTAYLTAEGLRPSTIALYMRIATRIERDYAGDPNAFLNQTLQRAARGTADSYRGAAAAYAKYRGTTLKDSPRGQETGDQREADLFG